MGKWKNQQIGDSVRLHSFTDSRYKTMRVSVNMRVPLARESAAAYGILPALVSRATERYPDYTALSARLAELYGASLSSTVSKMGEYQILSLTAGGISSRYAFGGEDMGAQLTDLLLDVFFSPVKDGEGLFPLDGFLQEKRQLLEMKDAEFNDKITYAHQRCEELLFEGQPGGMDRYGSRKEVEELDRKQVTDAWETLLSSAKFDIFVLGDCTPDLDRLQTKFGHLGSPQGSGMLAFEKPREVRHVEEVQPLSQSKLSMAYRIDCTPEDAMLFRLMAAVLGGVPSSKLFQNVREKMSLCYYCSAGLSLNSRTLFVESGVETENLEKAEREIGKQLEALQNGDLTEEELLSAKLALRNSLHAVEDSLPSLEGWCMGRTFRREDLSIQAAEEQLLSYTAQQVAQAAQKVYPAVVYCLKGSGSAK